MISRLLICLPTVGWVICSRRAAPVKLPFILENETQRQPLDWGRLGWLSSPTHTRAAQLAIVEGSLIPGKGHNFHKHPSQEEVMFVVDGRIEQWIDKEKQKSWRRRLRLYSAWRGPRYVQCWRERGQGFSIFRSVPRRWL